jgi:hypothetical protein
MPAGWLTFSAAPLNMQYVTIYNLCTVLQTRSLLMTPISATASGKPIQAPYPLTMNLRFIHLRRISLFSLLLFAFMQYSAVVHATAHYFHTPDQLCAVYNAIEHSKSGLITAPFNVPLISDHSEATLAVIPNVISCYTIFLPSRAPPQL